MLLSKTRNVKTPSRGTIGSAGLDFYVPEDFKPTKVFPGDAVLVPSGIKVNIPKGHALVGFNKSGVATKKQLIIGACVIDEDYQGEIHLHLINVGTEEQLINPGDKIAQFLCLPVAYVDIEVVHESDLYDSASDRGAGGFGHTDNK
jgi:dUTP pyrophosphatase